jgi:hypothetical protein
VTIAPAALVSLEGAPWESWMREAPAAFTRKARSIPLFILSDEKKKLWAGAHARSCGSCDHVKLRHDPGRGWCSKVRAMRGATFPVLCREYR